MLAQINLAFRCIALPAQPPYGCCVILRCLWMPGMLPAHPLPACFHIGGPDTEVFPPFTHRLGYRSPFPLWLNHPEALSVPSWIHLSPLLPAPASVLGVKELLTRGWAVFTSESEPSLDRPMLGLLVSLCPVSDWALG